MYSSGLQLWTQKSKFCMSLLIHGALTKSVDELNQMCRPGLKTTNVQAIPQNKSLTGSSGQ